MMKKLLLSFSMAILSAGALYAQPAGWMHRQDFRVTNTNSVAATEFQVLLEINTQQLILQSKMNTDGSDIRFSVDRNGSSFLPYFIEKGINTANTRIWIKLNEIPANGRTRFYMFYGNNAAANESTVNIFTGPFSASDSVESGGPGGAGNSQRGFRFSPTEDIFVTSFGKREPTGTNRYITLFDQTTQVKLDQVVVAGPAAQYSYKNLSQTFWLNKDKEYSLQMYQDVNDGYYFGSSSSAGPHIKYLDMRFCNSCDQNTFPTNSLPGMHYGYPDLHYYTRNQSIALMPVEFGPFIDVNPSTLPNGKMNGTYSQQLTAVEGIEPYTFTVSSGSLPAGLALTTDGKLSGTITVAGTFTFTVNAEDSNPDGHQSGANTYTFFVDKQDQVVTLTKPADKIYGDEPFRLEGTSSTGLPVSFKVIDGPAVVDGDEIKITGAGEVKVKAFQDGDDNYAAGSSEPQTFTVKKKALTITAKEQSKVYGDANPALTLTYDGLVYLQTEVAGISASTVATETSAVGEYDIVPAGSSDNYEITFIKGKLIIKQKELTVSLKATPVISKIYDGTVKAELADANIVLDGLINNDVVLVNATAEYSDANAEIEKIVRVNDFVLTGEAKANYFVSTAEAKTRGDIHRKAVTASVKETPVITKEYDGSDHVELTSDNYTIEGLVEGEEITVKGNAHFNDKTVGTDKDIKVSDLSMVGELTHNYELETLSAGAKGTITKRQVTIGIKQGSSVEKVYDGNTNAVFTSAVDYTVSGLIADDNVGYNRPASGKFENAHGGRNKKVTVDGLKIEGGDAANYELAATSASANIGTILPKPVTITAEAKTKVYGKNDPALSYVVVGLVGNDVLTGTLTRAEGSNVGEYAIQQGSVNGGTDYEIETFTSAELKITPASLLITAQDKTKKQGEVNPDFTFSYDGLANEDEPTDLAVKPTATTNAATGSPIGYYTITVAGASSPNYNITYAQGKLTVNPSDAKGNVKVWSSSPDVLQLRIYTEQAQKSNIILFTDKGQQVVLQSQSLNPGINSTTVNVGRLSPGIYVLNVQGENFKDVQMIKIK
ncbi:MAG: DUF2341 domain-containing protein [Chitinophagaceae bacterium]